MTTNTAVTEFTLVRNGKSTATYTRTAGTGAWRLASTQAASVETLAETLALTGATVHVYRNLPHLTMNGPWAETVDEFRESTPVEQVQATIASLRREAKQKETDAAYSGSWGDSGASMMRREADAMARTLAILTQHPAS